MSLYEEYMARLGRQGRPTTMVDLPKEPLEGDVQIIVAAIDKRDVSRAIDQLAADYEDRALDAKRGVVRDNLDARAARLRATAAALLKDTP